VPAPAGWRGAVHSAAERAAARATTPPRRGWRPWARPWRGPACLRAGCRGAGLGPAVAPRELRRPGREATRPRHTPRPPPASWAERPSRVASTSRPIPGTRTSGRQPSAWVSWPWCRWRRPRTSTSAVSETRGAGADVVGGRRAGPELPGVRRAFSPPCPTVLKGMRRDRRRLLEKEFLPGALSMAVDFQDCFNRDPLLPPELLPRPWAGPRGPRPGRDQPAPGPGRPSGARPPALFRFFDEAVETIPS